jgi:uncharacterized protein YecT (DUF1311 family)
MNKFSSLNLLLIASLSCVVPLTFASDEIDLKEAAKRMQVTVPELNEIIERCDGNQHDMNMCAWYKFVKSDIELNGVYRELQSNLDGRDPKKLVVAQKAWIIFRDKNCDFSTSDVDQGSMWGMVSSYCKRDMTEDRIYQLKDLIACTSIHGECLPKKH